MLWNRPSDKTPLPHFSQHDPRNLTAAHARLADLAQHSARDTVSPAARIFWSMRRRLTEEIWVVQRMQPSKPKALITPLELMGGLPLRLEGAARAIATLRGCRFPIGDVYSEDFRFCNEKRECVGPYCTQHAELCWRSRRRS
jgi:hypothetical protein